MPATQGIASFMVAGNDVRRKARTDTETLPPGPPIEPIDEPIRMPLHPDGDNAMDRCGRREYLG
jgi:hypothetical protein